MMTVLKLALLLAVTVACLPALAESATSAEIGEVGIGTIAQDASAVIQAWQVGMIAGLAAVVNLLTHLLKIPVIDSWLADRRKRWTIPYIALALGVVGGVLAGLSQGQPVVAAIMTGLLAGTTAIGTHEVIKRRKVEKRQA